MRQRSPRHWLMTAVVLLGCAGPATAQDAGAVRPVSGPRLIRFLNACRRPLAAEPRSGAVVGSSSFRQRGFHAAYCYAKGGRVHFCDWPSRGTEIHAEHGNHFAHARQHANKTIARSFCIIAPLSDHFTATAIVASVTGTSTAGRTLTYRTAESAEAGPDCRAAPGITRDRADEGASGRAACRTVKRSGRDGVARRTVTRRRIAIMRRRIILRISSIGDRRCSRCSRSE